MRYSIDFRRKVLERLNNGESKRSVAFLFNISRTTVHAWSQNDGLESLKPGPKRPRKLDRLRLKEVLIETPDAYLDELAKTLGVSRSTVGYNLQKIGYSRKKNDTLPSTKRRQAHRI